MHPMRPSLLPRQAAAQPCNCSDDQSIVDVLCVYTTLAKNAAGGAANLQARFQNAIDAANGAFAELRHQHRRREPAATPRRRLRRGELRRSGATNWINHLQHHSPRPPTGSWTTCMRCGIGSERADTVHVLRGG